MSLSRRALMETGGFAVLLSAAAGCSRGPQATSASLAELDAVETASRIAKGELGALEAVNAAIERAQRIEPKINAVVTTTYDAAREAAQRASGPLGGVPTFVKDLYDVPGVASGFGSRAFPGYKGGESLPAVKAFLDTGVVSLGKSTTPEFGLSATTESIATGRTRNPWNLNHSSGGSSGGAGALVAAGVVPIAHATDGGGSIRIPASCCGTVGLKVSRGRTPRGEPSDMPISLSTHGVESRTVRDTAAVAAAMARPAAESGLHPLDLITAPGGTPRRIALVMQGLGGFEPDLEVRAATEAVASVCESLGHFVEEATFPIPTEFAQDFSLYWAAMAAGVVSRWEAASGLSRSALFFEPFTLGLSGFFEKNKENYDAAVSRLASVAAMMEQMHERFDIILSPVLAKAPPELGWLDGAMTYETLFDRLIGYVQYTSLYNVSGAPSISLPLSMSQHGLPIGAMFGAPLGREDMLLELSYALEEAMPWSGRRPPIFG